MTLPFQSKATGALLVMAHPNRWAGDDMKIRDNRHFTLVWHAFTAFIQAKSIADLMCELQCRDKNDPRSAVLFGALAGYYARPFMKSNGLGHLNDGIVPEGYEKHHAQLIALRKKVFLHTDANAEIPQKTDINFLRFTVFSDKDTFCVHSLVPVPNAETFHDICQLLSLLMADLNAALQGYIRLKVPGTPMAPGDYILTIEGDQLQLKTEISGKSTRTTADVNP